MQRQAELELHGIENGSIRLRTKPSAQLRYSFVPKAGNNAGRNPERLLIFLSGLDSPKTVWQGTISRLADLAQTNGLDLPPLLAYDRFGVGKSDQDPTDVGKPPEEYHDGMDAVRDLRQLLIQIAEQKLDREESELDKLRIAFCAHSFGVCIARLYAQMFPGTVEALLIMDSALSNSLAEKFVPNPDIPEEWEEAQGWLPPGTTPEMCRDAIRKVIRSNISGYAMATRERIRWTNMPEMLPFNDRPRLRGPEPNLPLVTVMCCDPDVSIRTLSKMMKIPEELIRITFHRFSWPYKDGLPYLQGTGIGKGPIIARGCSHNIPGEGPELVASEMFELLVASSKSARCKI